MNENITVDDFSDEDFKEGIKTAGGSVFDALAFTDTGNSRVFAERYQGKVRYCHHFGKWLCWDGRRWKIDESGAVVELAKVAVNSMWEAVSTLPEDRQRAASRWILQSASQNRLNAMLNLAKSDMRIAVSHEELDADPWVICCENGILDLRSGELAPHDPAQLITKLVPTPFEPKAECPVFLSFLSQIFKGDEELIHFIQKSAGYSLVGTTAERVILLCYGSGRNGKTTLIDLFLTMSGDYAVSAPFAAFMESRHDQGGPTSDIARLRGARFVCSAESEEGRRFNASRLKALTGGDQITARFLYAEPFTFRPQFCLWFCSNFKPEAKANDQALWDRVRLVPFEYRVADENVDKELPAKLRTELPGVLAWTVRGALAWQREGLTPPKAVCEATNEYRDSMNVIGNFLEEHTISGAGLRVKAADLYKAFGEWCEENGELKITKTALGLQLKQLGFTSDSKSNARWWCGLLLKT